MSDVNFESILRGKATTYQLLELRNRGWSVEQLSRRLKVATGTIRRAIRHAENGELGILNVHPCLLTGEEDALHRTAIYYTRAYILHAIVNKELMGVNYYKLHEARSYATRRIQELARLKELGVNPGFIRLRMRKFKTPQ